MSPSIRLSIFLEIMRVTVRQLLGRRRTLLLLMLSALPILLALVFRAADEASINRFTRSAFDTVDMTILMPLVAILFGSGAFGAESDEGTLAYLLAKPIPRWVVVMAKATAATLLSVALTGTSTALAGLIAIVPEGSNGVAATEAMILAVVVGSVCYACLFLAVSLYTRRALVIGIGYMLVWEGALSVLLPGIANLSIRQYALGAASAIYKLPIETARLSMDTAFILAGVVLVGSLVVATRRLMRFELPGGSD
jgi:ABC-2 type transport system permease protein